MIAGVDKITRPKAISRTPEQQEEVQSQLKGMSLYQLYACPFCIKVRRAMHCLNVDVELRDIGKHANYRQELEEQGGRVKVPCLRIDNGDSTEWLYESSDIIAYLQQKVGEVQAS